MQSLGVGVGVNFQLKPLVVVPPPVGFLPTDDAGAYIWLDPSDAATLTLVGSNVSILADKINSNDLSQPNSNFRPQTGGSINGRNALSFDGVDDRLELDLTGQGPTFAVHAVFANLDTTNEFGAAVSMNDAGSNDWQFDAANDSEFQGAIRSAGTSGELGGRVELSPTDLFTGETAIVSIVFDAAGDTTKVYVDGVERASASYPVNIAAAQTLRLFSNRNTNGFVSGLLGEVVVTTSIDNVADYVTYLSGRWQSSTVAPTLTASDSLAGRTLTIAVDSVTGTPAPTTSLTVLTLDGVDVSGDATGSGPWQYVVPDSSSAQTVVWEVTASNSAGNDTVSGSEVVAANLTPSVDPTFSDMTFTAGGSGEPDTLTIEQTYSGADDIEFVGVTSTSATAPSKADIDAELGTGTLERFTQENPGLGTPTPFTGLTALSESATHIHGFVREVNNGGESIVRTVAVSGLDFTPLTFTSAEAIDANTVEVTLSENAVGTAADEDWDFTINGSPATITNVAIAGDVVTLTVSDTMASGDTLAGLAYTPGDLTDEDANALAAFSGQSITNSISAPPASNPTITDLTSSYAEFSISQETTKTVTVDVTGHEAGETILFLILTEFPAVGAASDNDPFVGATASTFGSDNMTHVPDSSGWAVGGSWAAVIGAFTVTPATAKTSDTLTLRSNFNLSGGAVRAVMLKDYATISASAGGVKGGTSVDVSQNVAAGDAVILASVNDAVNQTAALTGGGGVSLSGFPVTNMNRCGGEIEFEEDAAAATPRTMTAATGSNEDFSAMSLVIKP